MRHGWKPAGLRRAMAATTYATDLVKSNIRVASVSTLMSPDALEVTRAAETLWALATIHDAPLELYPAQ